MDEEKFDYVLSDGKKGRIDKSKVTVREWRRFWSPQCTDEETDAQLSKVTGLDVNTLQSMLLDDHRRLIIAFREKCQEPLNDPKK